MEVRDVYDCCGGVSIVLLASGRTFTARTKVVKKSGICKGESLKPLLSGGKTFLTFQGYILA